MGDALPAVDLGPGHTAVTPFDGALGIGRMVVEFDAGVGRGHVCARRDDGQLKCWGRNQAGQLGLGRVAADGGVGDDPAELGDAMLRVDLGSRAPALALGHGQRFACAILDAGVKCFGQNTHGELGTEQGFPHDRHGSLGDRLPYVDLGAGRSAVQLSATEAHVCALLDDDTVKCWGHGALGKLGQGDRADRGQREGTLGDALPPVALGAGLTPVLVNTGPFTSCALLQPGGVLKCWGSARYGRLGLGDGDESRGDNPDEMGDDLPAVDVGGLEVVGVAAGH